MLYWEFKFGHQQTLALSSGGMCLKRQKWFKGVCVTLLHVSQILQRILNARQFGLKLIANVTYGYTAAGFSGRMPCAELADSIVQVSS